MKRQTHEILLNFKIFKPKLNICQINNLVKCEKLQFTPIQFNKKKDGTRVVVNILT